MKRRKLWDISEFNKINLPEVVGKISEKREFSAKNNIRVLDMPIFMPGQGWKIPRGLHQFSEIVKMVIDHESNYGQFEDDHYVYITVDQKMVKHGQTGRRAGAHSDAYVEENNQQIDITTKNSAMVGKQKGPVSHTYIVADCIPTQFFKEKFPLDKTDCESSLKTFDEIAATAPVVTYPEYTVLKLDPYVVHRCGTHFEDVYRTFVKVSVSRKKYAREGNTRNIMFRYDWELTARSPDKRNHPWT